MWGFISFFFFKREKKRVEPAGNFTQSSKLLEFYIKKKLQPSDVMVARTLAMELATGEGEKGRLAEKRWFSG